MASGKILLLGNPLLYRRSVEVRKSELSQVPALAAALRRALLSFRRRHGCGRAIAAPQIGAPKRLLYVLIDRPLVLINPQIDRRSPQMMELWDDCMSFPDLLVRVKRHRSCRLIYRDTQWKERVLLLDGALSELLQHEIDHLDGILATMRAVDDQSFALKSQRKSLDFPPHLEPA